MTLRRSAPQPFYCSMIRYTHTPAYVHSVHIYPHTYILLHTFFCKHTLFLSMIYRNTCSFLWVLKHVRGWVLFKEEKNPYPKNIGLKDLDIEGTSHTPVGEGDGRYFLPYFPLLVGFNILNSGSDLLDLAGMWVPGAFALKGPPS